MYNINWVNIIGEYDMHSQVPGDSRINYFKNDKISFFLSIRTDENEMMKVYTKVSVPPLDLSSYTQEVNARPFGKKVILNPPLSVK